MRYHNIAAVAALSLGLSLASPTPRTWSRREFTLDEEEEQSVYRMLTRARHRRRMEQRRLEKEEKARLAAEAAAAEAARPKSRQELRAKARKEAKRRRPDRNFQKGERRI
jgi:hypothetical protein